MKKARAMFDGLTEDEKKQLSSLLEKMMEHWPRMEEGGACGQGWTGSAGEVFRSRQRTPGQGRARRKDGRQTFIKADIRDKGRAHIFGLPLFHPNLYCPLCTQKYLILTTKI